MAYTPMLVVRPVQATLAAEVMRRLMQQTLPAGGCVCLMKMFMSIICSNFVLKGRALKKIALRSDTCIHRFSQPYTHASPMGLTTCKRASGSADDCLRTVVIGLQISWNSDDIESEFICPYPNPCMPHQQKLTPADALGNTAATQVDYLKYDNCNCDAHDDVMGRYTAMRDALNATGRPILYSMCVWGVGESWRWGAKVSRPSGKSGPVKNRSAMTPSCRAMRPFDQVCEHMPRPGFAELQSCEAEARQCAACFADLQLMAREYQHRSAMPSGAGSAC